MGLLSGDCYPVATQIRTAALRTRAREHARAHTTAFGLFWRRSRMSWVQWGGGVDLMDEPLSLHLGVESGGIIPRARPLSHALSLAMKRFPDVFETSLELPANSATYFAFCARRDCVATQTTGGPL